jgi:hypothetical protein
MASLAPVTPGPFANGPAAAPQRDPRYDNAPPLEERLMQEFAEDLEAQGITARIQELVEGAAARRSATAKRSPARSGTCASSPATSRSASATPARSITARCSTPRRP